MGSSFKIKLPNGYTFDLLYNNKQNKKELLQKLILDKWEDYCNNHWLFQGKIDPYKFNHEDNVKNLLDRAATFLLFR